MFITVSIPVFKLSKETKTLNDILGFGITFNIHFVITPKVPSEPIIKFFKDNPELSFITFLPISITCPSAKTTSRPLT